MRAQRAKISNLKLKKIPNSYFLVKWHGKSAGN